MLEVLQVATVVLGVVTTFLSVYLAGRFYKVKHSLSTPLALMLGAEGVAGLITVLFSANSMANSIGGVDPALWNTLPPELAVIFRLVLFTTVGFTSIHLFLSIQKLSE